MYLRKMPYIFIREEKQSDAPSALRIFESLSLLFRLLFNLPDFSYHTFILLSIVDDRKRVNILLISFNISRIKMF